MSDRRDMERAFTRALENHERVAARRQERARRDAVRAAERAVPGAPRSFLVTWLLALLLGLVGADRFYLGKTRSAVVKLLTVGGIGIWYLVDLLLVLLHQQRDRWGRPLEGSVPPRVAWIVSGVVVGLSIVYGLVADPAGGGRAGGF